VRLPLLETNTIVILIKYLIKNMGFNSQTFENNGLKIDQDRILTYSQLSCPLDCRYCFVDDLNFNQKRNVSYLSNTQLDLLNTLPKEITLIMLGCDTEFFQNPQEAINILNKIVNLKKDISLITKLALSDKTFLNLDKINKQMEKQGNLLTFSVSIPCYESAQFWEPKAPSPQKRIGTLEKAKNIGIKTMVAIRPLLPNVSEQELECIIRETHTKSDGYYSGPLYLKTIDDAMKILIENNKCIVSSIQPTWMPSGNIFYKIEKPEQYHMLTKLLKKYDCTLFEGAAEGINFLKSSL
jgi:DNA repair photolyase